MLHSWFENMRLFFLQLAEAQQPQPIALQCKPARRHKRQYRSD